MGNITGDGHLHQKFEIKRTDGRDKPGEKHDGCVYFTLDLDHDPHARAALRAYAESCVETLPKLAKDIFEALSDSERKGGTCAQLSDAVYTQMTGEHRDPRPE